MAPDGIKSIDSLSAHEFQVELNGQVAEGVFSVHGLTSFLAGGELPPLTITKMVQSDPQTPFNAWAQETMKNGSAPRDLAIVAMDEGQESRRWVYKDAVITAIDFSDFDSAMSELVAERLTIKADCVEEIWR